MWVIRTKRERRRKEVERERFEEGYRVALSSLAHIYIRFLPWLRGYPYANVK